MFEGGGWGDHGDEPWPPEPVDDEPVDPVADPVALAVDELLATTSGRAAISARRLAAAEIGPALSLGSGAADTLVDTVIELRTRLRATFAAVVAGSTGTRLSCSPKPPPR